MTLGKQKVLYFPSRCLLPQVQQETHPLFSIEEMRGLRVVLTTAYVLTASAEVDDIVHS